MSLEANTGKIADLVVTNPTATDPVSQGDDHIRLLKNAVFSDAVTKTQANLDVLKAANGWVKLPSGIIIQWGQVAGGTLGDRQINYPVAFPTVALVVNLTCSASPFGGKMDAAHATISGLVSFGFLGRVVDSSGVTVSQQPFRFIAIGY